MNKQEYQKLVKKHDSPSPMIKNCIIAFLVGGAICVLAQFLSFLYEKLGFSEKELRALIPISMIFLACLFTGTGHYDKLAKRAGAGTLVPITGFANAMCSPAIDNKSEGWIMGVGAKMFTIAGPVIVYGTVASVIYGVIFWICTTFL